MLFLKGDLQQTIVGERDCYVWWKFLLKYGVMLKRDDRVLG